MFYLNAVRFECTRVAFKPNIALKPNMFYLNAVRFECTRVAFNPNIALKQNMFLFGLNAQWMVVASEKDYLKQNRFKIELELECSNLNLNLNVQTEHCSEVKHVLLECSST